MNPDDSLTTERLIREIQEMAGEKCPHCDEPVSLFDALHSRALGSRRRPKCLSGLAEFMGVERADLAKQVADYIEQRDCYRGAFDWIEAQPD